MGNVTSECLMVPTVDPEAMRDLFVACKNQDEERVRRLLESNKYGALLNMKEPRGTPRHPPRTPLLIAICSDSVPIAEMLLEHGADPNQPDGDGTTPLMWAALYGEYEMAQLLLDRGANVNGFPFPPSASSSLSFSSSSSSSSSTSLSFFSSISPSRTPSDSYSYSSLASSSSSPSVTESPSILEHPLFEKFVSLFDSSPSSNGETPKRQAPRISFDAPSPMRVEGSPSRVGRGSERFHTPLHIAARQGYEDIVKLLLERGADARMRTKKNELAAFLAVRFHHLESAKLLIEASPESLEATNMNGDTLLLWACLEGQADIAQYLCELSPACLQVVNLDGATPLLAAVRSNSLATVEVLLSLMIAQVDQPDNSGVTPLLQASSQGATDIAERLLLAGASVEATDLRHRSSLVEATRQRNAALVALLHRVKRNYKLNLQLLCWHTLRSHAPDLAISLHPLISSSILA